MADSPTQAETVDETEPEIDSADAEAVSVEEILVYTPSDLRGTAPADLFLEEPKPVLTPADSVSADSGAARPAPTAKAVAATAQPKEGAAPDKAVR